MVRNYIARPYDGTVLAVFCDQSRKSIWDSQIGPGTQQHVVDATHHELFNGPEFSQWMEWISDYITVDDE